MTKRNPIIEADDNEVELPIDGVTDADGGFEAAEADTEFTDEDVQEAMGQLEQRQLDTIRGSKERGRIASGRPNRQGRETPAQAAKRGRERELVWKPADTLDAPPARPGMDQRWVRYAIGDREDPRNWMRKQREGWQPRSLDDVSDEFEPPTIKHGSLGKVIGVPGLILCERPIELSRSRTRFMRAKLARQLKASSVRHINRVQRGDHPIDVQTPYEQPSVGRGTRRRRAEIQDGDE